MFSHLRESRAPSSVCDVVLVFVLVVFFTVRVIKRYNGLPGEVMKSQSLEAVRTESDVIQGNLL